MAKWGFGEASGARCPLARLGILGMLGVRTIMGDGLHHVSVAISATSAMSPAHRKNT